MPHSDQTNSQEVCRDFNLNNTFPTPGLKSTRPFEIALRAGDLPTYNLLRVNGKKGYSLNKLENKVFLVPTEHSGLVRHIGYRSSHEDLAWHF